MMKKINPLLTAIVPELRKVENHVSYAKLDCLAGSNITNAAKEAVTSSRYLENIPVNFTFNNVLLTGKSGVKPEIIERRYFREIEKKGRISSNSLNNKAHTAQWESKHQRDVIIAQGTANELSSKLNLALKNGEASTVEWIGKFDDAMDKGAKVDEITMKKITQMLKSKGYLEHDALNLPQEDYKNKSVIARYLIGQFMDCPGRGYAKMFADQYAAL